MVQLIITQANNGFVVETKGNGMLDINVATNLAQVVKAVKEAYKQQEAEIEAA
jgi:LEA14-like dessication related protein